METEAAEPGLAGSGGSIPQNRNAEDATGQAQTLLQTKFPDTVVNELGYGNGAATMAVRNTIFSALKHAKAQLTGRGNCKSAAVATAMLEEIYELHNEVNLAPLLYGNSPTTLSGNVQDPNGIELRMDEPSNFDDARFAQSDDIDTIITITNNPGFVTSFAACPKNFKDQNAEQLARDRCHIALSLIGDEYVPVSSGPGSKYNPGRAGTRINGTAPRPDGQPTHYLPQLTYIGNPCHLETSAAFLYQTHAMVLESRRQKAAMQMVVAWFTQHTQPYHSLNYSRNALFSSTVAHAISYKYNEAYGANADGTCQSRQGYAYGGSGQWNIANKIFLDLGHFDHFVHTQYGPTDHDGRPVDRSNEVIQLAKQMLPTVRFLFIMQQGRKGVGVAAVRLVVDDEHPSPASSWVDGLLGVPPTRGDPTDDSANNNTAAAPSPSPSPPPFAAIATATAATAAALAPTAPGHAPALGEIVLGSDNDPLMQMARMANDSEIANGMSTKPPPNGSGVTSTAAAPAPAATVAPAPTAAVPPAPPTANEFPGTINPRMPSPEEKVTKVMDALGAVLNWKEFENDSKFRAYIFPSLGAEFFMVGKQNDGSFNEYVIESSAAPRGVTTLSMHLMKHLVQEALAGFDKDGRIKRYLRYYNQYLNLSKYAAAGISMHTNGGLARNEYVTEQDPHPLDSSSGHGLLPLILNDRDGFASDLKIYQTGTHRGVEYGFCYSEQGQKKKMQDLISIVGKEGTAAATVDAVTAFLKELEADVETTFNAQEATDKLRLEVTPRIVLPSVIYGEPLSVTIGNKLMDGIALIDNVRIEKLVGVSESFALSLLSKNYIKAFVRAMEYSCKKLILEFGWVTPAVMGALVNCVAVASTVIEGVDPSRPFQTWFKRDVALLFAASKLQGYPTMPLTALALRTAPLKGLLGPIAVEPPWATDLPSGAMAALKEAMLRGAALPRAHFLAARMGMLQACRMLRPSAIVGVMHRFIPTCFMLALANSSIPFAAQCIGYKVHGAGSMNLQSVEIQHMFVGHGSKQALIDTRNGIYVANLPSRFKFNMASQPENEGCIKKGDVALLGLLRNTATFRQFLDQFQHGGLKLYSEERFKRYMDDFTKDMIERAQVVEKKLLGEEQLHDNNTPLAINSAVYSCLGVLSKADPILSTADEEKEFVSNLFSAIIGSVLLEARPEYALLYKKADWAGHRMDISRIKYPDEATRKSLLEGYKNTLRDGDEAFARIFKSKMDSLVAPWSIEMLQEQEKTGEAWAFRLSAQLLNLASSKHKKSYPKNQDQVFSFKKTNAPGGNMFRENSNPLDIIDDDDDDIYSSSSSSNEDEGEDGGGGGASGSDAGGSGAGGSGAGGGASGSGGVAAANMRSSTFRRNANAPPLPTARGRSKRGRPRKKRVQRDSDEDMEEEEEAIDGARYRAGRSQLAEEPVDDDDILSWRLKKKAPNTGVAARRSKAGKAKAQLAQTRVNQIEAEVEAEYAREARARKVAEKARRKQEIEQKIKEVEDKESEDSDDAQLLEDLYFERDARDSEGEED